MVAMNGDASDAVPDAGVGVPLVQVTLTETVAALFGMKSLKTLSVALVCVLVIVQDPVESVAEQVPVDVYPAGIGDSVAVHVGLPLYPAIVVAKGVVSVAVPEDGEAVPLVQLTVTLTEAPLFGMKSLFTTKAPLFNVFVIVQEPVPDGAPLIAPLHVPVEL
jgi:hypothetical protein